MESSNTDFIPSIETLQYYYNFVSTDNIDYWAVKEEYEHYNIPRTFIVRQSQQTEVQVQWLCFDPQCEGSFTRKADLERHVRTVHDPNPPRYDCPLRNCSRKEDDAFTREDHLKEHLRNFHKKSVRKRGEK